MNDGTISITLTFDEYRAVGAALVTSGDTLALGLMSFYASGGADSDEARLARRVLGLITGVTERITAARDAAGWVGISEAPDDVPENVEPAIN